MNCTQGKKNYNEMSLRQATDVGAQFVQKTDNFIILF